MDFSLTKPAKSVNPSWDLGDSQKRTEGSAQDYTESVDHAYGSWIDFQKVG